MTAINGQRNRVKEGLFKFIKRHIPTADLTAIDDIVLAYVVSILEEISYDVRFNIEAFIDTMAAYIPEFHQLDHGHVYSWMVELESQLSRRNNTFTPDFSLDSNESNISGNSNNDVLPPVPVVSRSRSHTNSESSEDSDRRFIIDGEDYTEQCRMLHEMFPLTCPMEIRHCMSIADGDISDAIATLLYRREHGQALSATSVHATRNTRIDDAELKSRIIARYSYVDKNSGTKEHKPLAPKNVPKKMVRYRDNKIVSLKGERYTEVPKSGADEENLKKPKKQHCP